VVNHKRLQRLWREKGLRVPQRRRRKRVGASTAAEIEVAAAPNRVWAVDFQFDAGNINTTTTATPRSTTSRQPATPPTAPTDNLRTLRFGDIRGCDVWVDEVDATRYLLVLVADSPTPRKALGGLRLSMAGCFLDELDPGGQVEFGVDVGEVGLYGAG
jgi:transposase InsO family protein